MYISVCLQLAHTPVGCATDVSGCLCTGSANYNRFPVFGEAATITGCRCHGERHL